MQYNGHMVTMCWTFLSCTDVIQAVHTDIQDLVSRPFLSKLKSRFPWPNLEYLGISYQFHSVAIKIICFSLWNTMNGLEVKKNIKPRFDVEPGASFRAPGWLIGDGQVKNTCLVARGKHYGIWCYGKLKWFPCDFGESRRLPVISFQSTGVVRDPPSSLHKRCHQSAILRLNFYIPFVVRVDKSQKSGVFCNMDFLASHFPYWSTYIYIYYIYRLKFPELLWD